MNQLNPKAQFQADKTTCEEWSRIASSGLFNRAALCAMAQLSCDGITAEELKGVNRFTTTLMNLAEVVEVIPQIPLRALKTFGPQPEKY